MPRLSLVLTLLLILSIAGCEEDDCTTCIGDPPALQPTLDNVWPNEDGRGWTYDFFHRSWPDSTTPPDVLLTIDDVDSLLTIEAPPEAFAEANIWRQVFEGTYTTGPGVTGQNLRGYYFTDVEGEAGRWVPVEVSARQRQLALPRETTLAELNARRICCVGGLLLEGGPAFVKTDELIGTYGEFDTNLSWKWLEADLRPGTRFTFPLLSGAYDIFLHCEVREVHDLSTPYGDFENALSVNYLIDKGEIEIYDEPGGTVIGTYRSYTVGRMEFVPGIGPVYTFERSTFPDTGLIQPDPELGTWTEEYEYWLIGTKVDESP